TDRGTYNTPIEIYALHSCQENMDYYLVNTGGTWTPEVAHYESAHVNGGQMSTDAQGNLHVDWENTDAHCTGGIEIAIGPNPDERICRYMDYPLNYEVDILPPSGPSVVQVNAAPAGDQGESTSYTSGFTFSISGGGKELGNRAERRYSGRRVLEQLGHNDRPRIGDSSRQHGQPRDVYALLVLHDWQQCPELYVHHPDDRAARAVPGVRRRPTATRSDPEWPSVQCRSDG